jgi:large subunit ribosomal protein L21
MFAIVKFGDIQYKVVPGEAIEVDNLPFEIDAEVKLNDLAMVSTTEKTILEQSELSKYTVVGSVLKHYRDDKVVVFKKKRRKGYTRKRGHRQDKTLLFIKEIVKS